MADRVSATIRIGGTLAHVHVPDLIAVIEREGVSTDWEGTRFSPADLERSEPLLLMAYEVAWGIFRELEPFCRDHGLAYVRWAGGYSGSFGPERVVFDGVNPERTFVVTDDDEVLISLADIRTLGTIEAIEAHFAAAEFTVPPLLLVDPDAVLGRDSDAHLLYR